MSVSLVAFKDFILSIMSLVRFKRKRKIILKHFIDLLVVLPFLACGVPNLSFDDFISDVNVPVSELNSDGWFRV